MKTPSRRVAVVYQHLPHYREPVFRLMSESADIEYHFLASPYGENGIRTVPRGHLPHTHDLTNRWIGPFLVQCGLLTSLWRIRPHAIIFLGDFRYLTTWINAVIQRACGVRVYFWTQGWRRTETEPRATIRRVFYRLAHHLFVYGSRSRALGIDAGFSPDRITAIGNSQITTADLECIPTHRAVADELRIGAVMRLNPNKKVTQLADIAAALTRRGLTTHVHVAGEGTESSALVSACAAAGVPLRTYGGIHSEQDLAAFYAELDVCVIPGAAGLSVLQALSHGRPVVTNDTLTTQGPEVEAIVTDTTGNLVSEDNTREFAEAIARWGERLNNDDAAVAAACVEAVRGGWVADRQAELIGQQVRREIITGHKVAVVNPNASKDRYSGPNIFMDRLFAGNDWVAATIVTGSPDAAEAFPWAKVAVPIRYDRSGRMSQLKWMAALTAWLWHNSRSFDVIHAHGVYLFNLLPLFAAQMRGVPVVLVPLGEDAELRFTKDRRRQPLARLRRRVVRRASLGLALSRKTQQELIAAGLPPARVGPIGNPVDTETFHPPEHDTRFHRATIGFIGVLGDRKGAHVVLEALDLLRSRTCTRDVGALFVGPFVSEDYERHFATAIDSLGLHDFVEVTGYTQSVADHAQRMSLLALPSNQEGLPGALVEAMATGLPAVVTDVGAMGDVVRSADAGHVIERSAAALADAIESILHDQECWKRYSRNAHEHAFEHYSVSSVQLSYERALNSIFTGGVKDDG